MRISNLPVRTIMEHVAGRHGLTVDHLLAQSRCPRADTARGELAANLFDRGMSSGQVGQILNRNRSNAWRSAKSHKKRVEQAKLVADAAQRYSPEDLEYQMRKFLGYDLTLQIVSRLDMPTGQAALLTVLIEAFPAVLSNEQACERYDALMCRLTSRDTVSNDDLLKQQVKLLRKHFLGQGLPDPVVRTSSIPIVLSEAIAPWLHNHFGKPIVLRQPKPIYAGMRA